VLVVLLLTARITSMATKKIDMWMPSEVAAVARVLGDTENGLTGTEIAEHLALAKAVDPGPITKRHRIEEGLLRGQALTQAGNCVVGFINSVMRPIRWAGRPKGWYRFQAGLNEVLVHKGLCINDEGRVATARRASTLDEAARLAGRLQTELRRRGAHPEATRYCEEELLRRSTFHAMFEATKGLAERLRALSGAHDIDGTELVDHCFGTKGGDPVLRINTFSTKSEISEHTGFANLLRGIFGTFRNPMAHTARIAGWEITESDALDLFSMLSYLHRRLDGAVRR
jgi:uncharacterized protein (TIGR02391 family)